MADTRRRIIVDGLEPGAIVRFPLILRSVPSAFQPPRLVVAFLLLLALVLPGRAWDAVRGPRIEPGQLLGLRDEDAAARERVARRAILERWAPLSLRGDGGTAGEAAAGRDDGADDPGAGASGPTSAAAGSGDGATSPLDDPALALAVLDRAYVRWREDGRIVGAAAEGDQSPPAASRRPGSAARPATAPGADDGDDDGDDGDDGGDDAGSSRAPDAEEADGAGEAGGTGGAAAAAAGAGRPSSERYRLDRAVLVAQLPRGEFAAAESAVHGSVRAVAGGLLTLDLGRAWTGVRRLFVDLPVGAWTHAPLFTSVFAPLVLVAWALGGGTLSRMATVFVARGERSTVLSAVAFARGAWPSLLLAPLVPLIAAAVCLVPAVLVGLVLHVPAVNVVGGVLYGLAVLAAVGAAVLLLGLGLGAPLVTAVVAAERCDAIDAAQRPYAYLLRRPVQLVGYLGLAVIAAAATYVVAAGVAGVALDLAAGAASVLGRPEALAGAAGPPLLGPDPAAAGGGAGAATADGPLASAAAAAVGFWRELLLLLAGAAVLSAWASATTAAYLLLRQSVDGQDPEEIWLEGMVPGTFAHRVPVPADDHGVAPPRVRRPRGVAAPATAPEGTGVPAAVEAAAADERRAEAGERVAGEELGEVLAEADAPRPSGAELASEAEAEAEAGSGTSGSTGRAADAPRSEAEAEAAAAGTSADAGRPAADDDPSAPAGPTSIGADGDRDEARGPGRGVG